MKTQKENNDELDVLVGQISLEDIVGNADDGTYGKPIDEFKVI